jgi:CBS domain-containing protein
LATRNKRASEISVGEVVQTPVYTCSPDDDVHAALETMKQHYVRRLPVEGFGGTVMGIVSMNDIVLASGPRKPVRDVEVVNTLQAICAHHHPSPHIAAA